MSLAELVVTSVMLEGRCKGEVARDYRISRCWVHQLVRRYELEGEAALRPRSRRPHRNPRAVDSATEDRIVRLRKELSRKGFDAGAKPFGSICSATRPAPVSWPCPRSGGFWCGAGAAACTGCCTR
jgi:hypothetical protein